MSYRQFEALRSSPHRQIFFKRVLLSVLIILATISMAEGTRNAIQQSQDLQWSPTKLLMTHVDPWAEYLRGDPNHVFLQNQYPNYLPVLYVLIFPLGLLPLLPAKLLWLTCNIAFAILSAILAARFYGLRCRTVQAVICLLLVATPTRNTIGNGQQGLLVLLLWCLSVAGLSLTGARTAVAGLSYGKFNFAPPVAIYLLVRGGLRSVLIRLLPSIFSIGLVWFWIARVHNLRSLAEFALAPLLVWRTGYFPSASGSNWMDVLEFLLLRLHTPKTLVTGLTLGSALLICFVILYFAVKRQVASSIQWQLALMATMSFGLFKHHPYDSVVLLFPLCYALHYRQATGSRIVLFLIGFIWYGQRILDASIGNQNWTYFIHFGILMLILGLTYRLREFEKVTASGASADPSEWLELSTKLS